MKTKTLLIAAAALVAGVISSDAQVYSANIVGYANVVLPGNGQLSLVSNPFDDGNGNYLTNILNSSLVKQSQVLTWNGSGFTIIQKGGTPANWPAGTVTQLPPGTGFFVRNGGPGSGAADLTNTFVGSVIAPVGTFVTNSEPIGLTLQGSTIPYAGNIAYAAQGGGDTNLDYGNGLTKQSQILTWDPVGQTYLISQKGGSPATWGATVPISVGQGFFINNKNGPNTNMVQGL